MEAIHKRTISFFNSREDLNAEGWVAINKNHSFLVSVNEAFGVFRSNKFIKNGKSNVCSVVDLYSKRSEIINVMRKKFALQKSYYDPGKTKPSTNVEISRINNHSAEHETYLSILSPVDGNASTVINFTREKPKFNH